MRLIDADNVNKTIDRFIGYLDEDMILRIKMKISKIPTVERPHGEWIERLEWLKQKEPNSMSPSYEYIKGWNDAIDAIVERMKEGDEK